MGDNISRQAAKDAIAEKVFHNLTDEFYGVMQVLDELPSTDRRGHWIQKDYYDADWNVYECDQCGEPWQLEAGTPRDNNMNFCPNCGAHVIGGAV